MSAAPEAHMVDNVLSDALSALGSVQALIELGTDGTLVFSPCQRAALEAVVATSKTVAAYYGAMVALLELAGSHGKRRSPATIRRA